MASEATVPPSLPPYAPPKDRKPATLPEGVDLKTTPTIINKIIGQMLKPKLGKAMSKMMTNKKIQQPLKKLKKKKII